LFIGVLHTNFGNRRAAITCMWVLSCIALYVCCMTVVSVTAAFAQLVSFSCQSLGGRCARRRCLSYSPGGATSESRRQNGTAPTSTLLNVCIKHATNFVMQTKQVSKIIWQKAASPPRLVTSRGGVYAIVLHGSCMDTRTLELFIRRYAATGPNTLPLKASTSR